MRCSSWITAAGDANVLTETMAIPRKVELVEKIPPLNFNFVTLLPLQRCAMPPEGCESKICQATPHIGHTSALYRRFIGP